MLEHGRHPNASCVQAGSRANEAGVGCGNCTEVLQGSQFVWDDVPKYKTGEHTFKRHRQLPVEHCRAAASARCWTGCRGIWPAAALGQGGALHGRCVWVNKSRTTALDRHSSYWRTHAFTAAPHVLTTMPKPQHGVFPSRAASLVLTRRLLTCSAQSDGGSGLWVPDSDRGRATAGVCSSGMPGGFAVACQHMLGIRAPQRSHASEGRTHACNHSASPTLLYVFLGCRRQKHQFHLERQSWHSRRGCSGGWGNHTSKHATLEGGTLPGTGCCDCCLGSLLCCLSRA